MVNKIKFVKTDVSERSVVGGNIAHGRGVIQGFIENGWDVECFVPYYIKDILGCPKGGKYFSFNSWVGEILFNMYLRRRIDNNGIIYVRFSGFSDIPYRLKNKNNFIVLEYNSSACWVMENWVKKRKGIYMNFLKSFVCKNENKVIHSADLIVVVSDVLKDILIKKGVNKDKILVNPNGVDPYRFSPSVNGDTIRERYNIENKIVFGFVGTFGPWHGVEVLVQAYSNLIKQYDDYKKDTVLMLIGDGIKMSEVLNIIEKESIEKNVILTGIVPYDNIPLYLAACDILVSPHVPNPDGTPFFGSPTKLFEYMAMGKPIIASNLNQISEILEDGYSAIMFNPGDIEGLTNSLYRVLNMSSDEKCILGRNARKEVIDKYTWKKHVERIIKQIED